MGRKARVSCTRRAGAINVKKLDLIGTMISPTNKMGAQDNNDVPIGMV